MSTTVLTYHEIDTSSESKSKSEEKLDKLRDSFFPFYIRYLANMINKVHEVFPVIGCRLAMACFCLSVKKRLSLKAKAFYEGGIKVKHVVDGRTCYSYHYGDRGPKVLLLHGYASYGYRWRNYVQELVSLGFQPVVLDAPGHGSSPGYLLSVPNYINVVRAVLEKEEEWYGVVSHSMGSLIGMIALSESGLKLSSNRFVAMSTFSDCDGLLTRYGACIGFNKRLMGAVKSWVASWTGKPLSYFSFIERAQDLDLDIQLIYDDMDIVVPTEEPEKIVSETTLSDITVTSGLGHSLSRSEICERALSFLTSSRSVLSSGQSE